MHSRSPVLIVQLQEMASENLHSMRRVARNEFKLAGIRIRQKDEKTKK